LPACTPLMLAHIGWTTITKSDTWFFICLSARKSALFVFYLKTCSFGRFHCCAFNSSSARQCSRTSSCIPHPSHEPSHPYVWHVNLIRVSWPIRVRDMTLSCATASCATLFFQVLSARRRCCSFVWHVSFLFVTWLLYACNETHSHVCRDSFTPSCPSTGFEKASFICVTWLIYICDMTHLHG